MSFVHLHNHSSYSLLDGMSDVDDMMIRARELEQSAIAITDHGNMFGAYHAWKAGRKHDVKAIVGIEGYLAPGDISRTEKSPVSWAVNASQSGDDVAGRGAYTHATLWAENNTGLGNLFKLSSRAWMDGFYSKPRMDQDLFNELHEGIIATTGCPSGEIQTRLRLGQYDEALKAAATYQEIFGKENYFLEVMNHGLDIETRIMADLLKIGETLNIPPLLTNDSHYIHQADAAHHEAMLCVQSKSTLDNPNRFKFDGEGYYLKSSSEMRSLFPDMPEAADNTLLIAERCDVSFTENQDLLPVFPVPDGHTLASWLRHEAREGLATRFNGNPSEEHLRQLEYECDVIDNMGFPGYFLVVADLISWAKQQGIRVGPGRGSAAGSMVAYATGITELDPIEHKLLFERFLNPDRVSMPDIDIDFDDTRREEVVQYVIEKYGADKVAQLVTFGKMKAKAALKDAARIHNMPYAFGEKISAAFPKPVAGRDMSLKEVYDENSSRYVEAQDFRDLVAANDDAIKITETAKGMEGVTRSTGVHAAGVVISNTPLMDVIPLMRREDDGAIITQFEQKTCETLGLLKMDFLGLRNLKIMTHAVELIKETKQLDIDLNALPLTDNATFDLLSHGNTLGIFQLDSPPMRSLLISMKPDSFEDISAVLALYRPGPMAANAHNDYADRKNGRKPVTPIHPELAEPLENILGDTYGLIVYQEQVMAIAQQLANYTLGEADLFRRAMGKKDKDALALEFEKFSKGMTDNGYSTNAIQTLWDILLPFSDYAFNKAHTAGYGLIAYQTAWLKANHPDEYMSALLTSVQDDKDKTALYMKEAQRMGLIIAPPDVASSLRDYTPTGNNTIRIGLSAVRNVGEQPIQTILTARDKKPFESFTDFVAQTPGVNTRAVESLVKAGAVDSLRGNISRAALVAATKQLVTAASKTAKTTALGQDDLFATANIQIDADDSSIPFVPEWDRTTLLAFEREMLGLYISDHPLRGHDHDLHPLRDGTIAALFPNGEVPQHGKPLRIAGVVTHVEVKKARNGNSYANLEIEDTTGHVNLMCFSQTWEASQDFCTVDTPVAVLVRIQHRESDTTLIADSIVPIDLTEPIDVEQVAVEPMVIPVRRPLTQKDVDLLKSVLVDFPGETPVHLRIEYTNPPTVMKVQNPGGVFECEELQNRIMQVVY